MAKKWKMYRLDEESDKIISELTIKWIVAKNKPMSKQEMLNWVLKDYIAPDFKSNLVH